MDLAKVLDTHRVIVCVGSGGVGKTTTSAALAVTAAAGGRQLLRLTIDLAKRLTQSLGLSELQGSELEVPPELSAPQGVAYAGSLSALMLDMEHIFDDLVARHAASPQQRRRILDDRRYLARAIFFTRKLRESSISQRAMLIDRVYAPLEFDGDRAALEAQLHELPSADGSDARQSRTLEAAESACVLPQRGQQDLSRPRRAVGPDLAYVEASTFDRDVHDLAALATLSRHLAPAP
jgi:hypothetical protein